MVPLKAIGLMSGTFFDGIEAAFLETNGITLGHTDPESLLALFGTRTRPAVVGTCRRQLSGRPPARPGVLTEAKRLVTEAHAQTVERLFQEHGVDRTVIAIVGFTVGPAPSARLRAHGPDWRRTAVGTAARDPGRLRFPCGRCGSREREWRCQYTIKLDDVLDWLKPVAVLNIGGVANVTVETPLSLSIRAPIGGVRAKNGWLNPPENHMAMLAARLAPDRVVPASAVGWSADGTEAQAFAYLAVRTLQGRHHLSGCNWRRPATCQAAWWPGP
jgi:1,6-anhydro-N-acetylmuramate kinase